MRLPTDDTTEILQLYARYNTAIDTGDADGFANCFVPDGLFDNGVAVIEGRDGISKFAEQTHSAMPGMRHNAMNIVADGVFDDWPADLKLTAEAPETLESGMKELDEALQRELAP